MNKKKIYIDYPTDKKRGDLANAVMWSVTLLAIVLMIVASVRKVETDFYHAILALELIISFLFLIDFLIRAHLSWRKKKYFTNIFNIFDLFASIPFILAFWLKGYFAVDYLKVLRATRIFRVFRLGKYFVFLTNLWKALKKNAYKYKIAWVFFLICLLIWSFLIYATESHINPWFSNIPNSMWRTLVTMSTVWYGDVYPTTVLGKIIWSVVILFGPIFLAIISSISIVTFLDVMRLIHKESCADAICHKCKTWPHADDATYCRVCWEKLSSHDLTSDSDYFLDKY